MVEGTVTAKVMFRRYSNVGTKVKRQKAHLNEVE